MYCVNPKTQRNIKVNGPTFKKLLKEGTTNYLYRNVKGPLLNIVELDVLILNLLDDVDVVHLSMTCDKALAFYRDRRYVYERCLRNGLNPSQFKKDNYLDIYRIIDSYFYFKLNWCKTFINNNHVVRICQLYHPWEESPKWRIQLDGNEMTYDYHMYQYHTNTIIYNGVIYK